MLAELENIDDECDQNDIAFVKIDDDKEAEEWGIDEIPTIVNITAVNSKYCAISLLNEFELIFIFGKRCSMNVASHTFTKVI